eukprot:TRINITY_DN8893_c0_g1_i1.p1 TRINITY_DN8893_c0_g1~~TRINITY_DN8893_c0_g1_i1.p1  ORF type:complete len:230 (+),score=43.52 TRINITY_DN8893_c0_g1_i1:13-702(+)
MSGIEGFVKFPRTHHIIDAGGSAVTRDDLVMSNDDKEFFFSNTVRLEEKIDGSNLGISIDENYNIIYQNRSKIVTSATASQWKGLDKWLTDHPGVWEVLTSPDIILFGEWCFAVHSIHYTKLPDYFIAFDIYLKSEQKFVCREELERRLEGSGIPIIRVIDSGIFSKEEMLNYLDSISEYRDGTVEGIYVRVDDEQFSLRRGKIVRPDFIQGIDEHWTKKGLIKNLLLY